MRIHTSATYSDVWEAARQAKVDLVKSDEHGSRTADRAFEINLEGESHRRPNNRGASDGYAATWDQWGVFLGHLYRVDPNTMCGSVSYPVYKGATDFHIKTNFRFEHPGFPHDYHGDHKFEHTGVPFLHKCKKCSATVRYN